MHWIILFKLATLIHFYLQSILQLLYLNLWLFLHLTPTRFCLPQLLFRLFQLTVQKSKVIFLFLVLLQLLFQLLNLLTLFVLGLFLLSQFIIELLNLLQVLRIHYHFILHKFYLFQLRLRYFQTKSTAAANCWCTFQIQSIFNYSSRQYTCFHITAFTTNHSIVYYSKPFAIDSLTTTPFTFQTIYSCNIKLASLLNRSNYHCFNNIIIG